MVIYRMIRTVGVADAQEQLNEMVRCLENGDHIYIQDIDPLTPEYEMPEVTPEQYKILLKKHYGNRLLKDHWRNIDKWDYFYLKEEPKPKPMEYPPEFIDTDVEEKEEKVKQQKDNKGKGKKKLTLKDIFLSSGNKRVKKDAVEEKKEEPAPKPYTKPVITLDLEEPEPVKPARPRAKAKPKAPVAPAYDEYEDEEYTEEPEPPKPVRKPRTVRQPKTVVQNRKPTATRGRKPKAKEPEVTDNIEEMRERNEKMNQKIQSIVEEYEGKN